MSKVGVGVGGWGEGYKVGAMDINTAVLHSEYILHGLYTRNAHDAH